MERPVQVTVANCVFEIELDVNNYDGFFGVQCECDERVKDKIKLNMEQISFNRKTRNTLQKNQPSGANVFCKFVQLKWKLTDLKFKSF